MWKVPDGRSSDKLSEIPVPISKDQNWGETGFSLSFIDWKVSLVLDVFHLTISKCRLSRWAMGI